MSSLAWKNINWPLVDSRIFRYQTRIFKASRENNLSKVRCLQKRLLNSLDAKLIAVNHATTIKKGKYIRSNNKQVFITDLQKEKLVKGLRLEGKKKSNRGIHIDKSGKIEKTTPSIKKIRDKAKQALCLLVLEPEWEARFEVNSYGFRPGRYCHDAIEAIFLSLQIYSNEKNYHRYILETNVIKCLNQINDEYLIKKLNTLPEIESQVETWLKAGVLNDFLNNRKKTYTLENIIGSPQEEIISPLLANITLHGLENHMKEWISTKPSFAKTNHDSKPLTIIRYTDNLVLIHKNKTIISEAKEEISNWLCNGPCLTLNQKKTSIHNSNEGFNFLGFSIITIRRGNKTRVKIYPSRESQGLLLFKIREIIQKNRNISAYNLILILQPILIGWANYFRYSECKECFQKLTYLTFQKLRAWVFRRDTRNGKNEVKLRYFPNDKVYYYEGQKHKDNWVLNGKKKFKNEIIKEIWLPHLVWIKRKKWIKIKGDKSPFDGDTLYWKKRIFNTKNCKLRQHKLIKSQNVVCP